MEIVKSGELLETQIREDARARAERLRAAAEKECAAIRAEGEARLLEESRRLDEAREAEIARLRRELEAALPLEFRRARLAFLQDILEKAVAAWIAGLSDGDVGRIIQAQTAPAAAAFAGRRVIVYRAGIGAEQAREIATHALPGAVVEGVADLPTAEAAVKGIVVECTDRSRRLRATIGELTKQLIEERRQELITALVGKDANK